MASVVLDNDVFFVPEPLHFIQLEVSQPHYICKDCGNKESALFHDGLCAHCTDRMGPEQGMSMRPKEDRVQAGAGQNMVIEIQHPPEAVSDKWEQVKGLTLAEALTKLDLSNEVDIQVSKLLEAKDYMNEKRRLLAEQITTLKAWLGSV